MRFSITVIAVLLSAWTLVYAQPQIRFDRTEYDFGTILWNMPVSVEYKLSNTGNKPLVISNVTVSCACALVDWPTASIPPGGEEVIKATFDAKALGHFHKMIGVYSNALPEPVYVEFMGKVATEVDNTDKLFPYRIGNIALDRRVIEFEDADWGEELEAEIKLANLSEKDYTPVLMHLPPYLKAEATPGVLHKKQAGVIKLTLNTRELDDLGLTQVAVYLSRFPGDKVDEENRIDVSTVLLPDFSFYTEQQLLNAARISLSEQQVDMGVFGNRSKLTKTIVISNKGNTPLDIRKLQIFNPSVSVSLKKSLLPAGASTKLKITLSKEGIMDDNQIAPRVLIITNDPQQPKTIISLKAALNKK